ncbi:MAG: DUF642 domain-containing protein [candidate division Zixibacteria bacterium]|nr:DUF642 domain-containing protein [candidate division Zixibacteria bacterium]NIW49982.1 DUF642 domain-containing protein [Gammaproteobacteria bacterium]NIX59423.1 DUF642 domain-containing protein [candidate division Zixibacteria bacterium]
MIDVTNSGELLLPSIASMSQVRFDVDNNAKVIADQTPSVYSSSGFWGFSNNYRVDTFTWPLMTAIGTSTLLDLSSITYINAGFNSSGDDRDYQQITASSSATIDLSGVQVITTPYDGSDRIEFTATGGSTIELDSLGIIESTNSGRALFSFANGSELKLGDLYVQASGTTFALNGGSILRAKGLRASKSTTITLNNPNDLLEVTGDFDLGTTITISNPGDAKLALGGDFTYAHTDETKVPFGNSYVYFNGTGPQKLEVGGYDASTFTELLANDNFGFGQMIISGFDRCGDQPSVVLLIDYIDNGNRGGLGGDAEALYLFGKDADANGLRILDGSTLYMCNLNVYAMIDGVMTDLRTLFPPGQACIPFDEGTLCLGCPDVDGVDNLITNGGFEYGVNPPDVGDPCVPLLVDSNDITGWIVTQNGIDWIHEAYFTDPPDPCDGQRTVDLCGTAVGRGGISQKIETVRGNLYHVFFDLGANPYGNLVGDAGEKILNVSVAGDFAEFSFDSTNQVGPDPGQGNPWQVYWQKKTWRFIAKDVNATLVFASDDPNTEYGVAIDNVIIHDAGIYADESECLNCSAPEYGDWVAWSKPDCWCYPRQCRGDSDGIINGPFWVGIPVLSIFRGAFNKSDEGLALVENGICCDFDHIKTGPFRVAIPDLNILRQYFNQPESNVPECDEPPIYTGPYNFWTSP